LDCADTKTKLDLCVNCTKTSERTGRKSQKMQKEEIIKEPEEDNGEHSVLCGIYRCHHIIAVTKAGSTRYAESLLLLQFIIWIMAERQTFECECYVRKMLKM